MAPSSAVLPTRQVAAHEIIERAAHEDLSTRQVIEQIVRPMARALDPDAFCAGAADPDTGLFMSAGLAHEQPEAICAPFWEHEFLVTDYNKFRDLTAAEPVGDLRQATGGKLSRSPRYRTLNALADFEDELRAALYAGGRAWGYMQVNRRTGGAPFTEGDPAFLRATAPLAGAALRRALLDEPVHPDPFRGPGVIVVDRAGAVISTTAEADEWLEELPPASGMQARTIDLLPRLLARSLGVETGTDTRPRRARLRTQTGTWLVTHAASLGGSEEKVIVIERAKASEIAPIVVEAYGLTGRETEVTGMVARGRSTDEIAAELYLSRHTVRDHLKSIFEKVGVSSRGELTAKLFADHYQPSWVDGMRPTTIDPN
jgi:DNA-binding CsgD family transcriptional regulator